MNPRTIAILNILISIVFALTIILFSAYYPESFPESMYIILILWIIPSSILNYLGAKSARQ